MFSSFWDTEFSIQENSQGLSEIIGEREGGERSLGIDKRINEASALEFDRREGQQSA